MNKPCRLPEPYFSLYLPSLFLCRHTSMFLRCWWDSNPQGHTILFLTSILYKTRPICHSATAPLKKLTYCISQRFSQPNVLNIITNLSKNNEQEFRVAKIRFFFRTAKTLMFFYSCVAGGIEPPVTPCATIFLLPRFYSAFL